MTAPLPLFQKHPLQEHSLALTLNYHVSIDKHCKVVPAAYFDETDKSYKQSSLPSAPALDEDNMQYVV
jgi:hypothetical protein